MLLLLIEIVKLHYLTLHYTTQGVIEIVTAALVYQFGIPRGDKTKSN
jgi:hypothetical protein